MAQLARYAKRSDLAGRNAEESPEAMTMGARCLWTIGTEQFEPTQ